MATTTKVTPRDPFVWTLASPATVRPTGEIVIGADNLIASLGSNKITNQSSQPGSTITNAIDNVGTKASTVRISAMYASVTAGATIFVPCPVAGNLSKVIFTASSSTTSANITVTATISGQTMSGNVLTYTSGNVAGTVASITPAGTTTTTTTKSVQLTLATTNATAGTGTVILEFTY